MGQYKCTIMWNQSVMGVSETYYTSNRQPDDAAKNLDGMLQLRNAIMFDDQFWVGVRVSQYGVRRAAAVLLPGQSLFPGSITTVNVPTQGRLASSGQAFRPDQLRATAQLQLGFGNGRTAIRYLSGIPDVMSATEPATIDYGSSQQWRNRYFSWRDYLVSNAWGILGQSLPPQNPAAPVVGITNGPGTSTKVGIWVTSATAPAFSIGMRVALQGCRPAKGTRASTLNGTWYVDSVDTTVQTGYTVVYLRGSDGIVAASQRFTDKTMIRPVVPQIYQIQSLTLYRIGIHKRGRPSLAPRGRRLSRASLDP